MIMRFKMFKLCASAIFIFTIHTGSAFAAQEILLNCDRYDGEQKFQIYVNEEKGYVIYNADVRNGNYERMREYSVDGGEEGETLTVDDGLTISINNDAFIQANDQTHSFVFIKATATYAYAWTSLVPVGDGALMAFANHHEGKCSANPFARPD